MDCRDLETRIDAWWDRELPDDQAEVIEAHLAGCPACLRTYGPVNELLTRPDPVEVPPGLRGRILDAVLGQQPGVRPAARRSAWTIRLGWVGALAASVALAFTTGYFFRVGHEAPTIAKIDPSQPQLVVTLSPATVAMLVQSTLLANAAGPAATVVQAVAFEQVTSVESELVAPTLIRTQPPASGEDSALVPQLPLIINRISSLGA